MPYLHFYDLIISFSNPLQLIHVPQFGKPLHIVTFNAIYISLIENINTIKHSHTTLGDDLGS